MATYTVGSGKDYSSLVTALAAPGLADGDTLVVTAGESFTAASEFGHSIPHRSNITVKSSLWALLPTGTDRIDPRVHASYCFKIKCDANRPGLTLGDNAVSGGTGAHDWTFTGMLVESAGDTTTTDGIVLGGSQFGSAANRLACYNFTFNQCVVIPAEVDPDDLICGDASSMQVGFLNTIVGCVTNGCWIMGGTGNNTPTGGLNGSVGLSLQDGTFTDHNSWIQAWQNAGFFGGSGGGPHPDRQPTVSASSINIGAMTGTASLSSVVDFPEVGDYIAFKIFAVVSHKSTHRVGVCTGVTPTSGSTADITYDLKDGSPVDGSGWHDTVSFADEAGAGGPITVVAPLVGSLCQWDGTQVGVCTFTRTHWSNIQPEQVGSAYNQKAWIEIKAGTITFNGCTFEDAKGGTVVVYPQNQDGTQPWITTNVTFINPLFYGSKGCVGLNLGSSYHVAVPSTNNSVTIRNGYDHVISGSSYTYFGQSGSGVVTIDHFHSTAAFVNGVVNCNTAAWPVTITNSILVHGAYGLNCYSSAGTGFSSGNPTCYGASFAAILNKTVLIDTTGILGYFPTFYPDADPAFFVANLAAVGFTDVATKNFQLTQASPFKGQGTLGSDPGVDWSALYAAVNPEDWPLEWLPTGTSAGDRALLLYA